MADDDDDLDAMWDDLGGDDTVAVSANLADAVNSSNSREHTVHAGDVDEGRITWEPPSFHGLSNSTEVTVSSRHWYNEGTQATDSLPNVAATPTTAAAQTTPQDLYKQPGFSGAPAQSGGMFQFNPDGSIKW